MSNDITKITTSVQNDDNRFDLPKGTTFSFELKENLSIPMGTIRNIIQKVPNYMESFMNDASQIIDVKVNGNKPLEEVLKFKRNETKQIIKI